MFFLQVIVQFIAVYLESGTVRMRVCLQITRYIVTWTSKKPPGSEKSRPLRCRHFDILSCGTSSHHLASDSNNKAISRSQDHRQLVGGLVDEGVNSGTPPHRDLIIRPKKQRARVLYPSRQFLNTGRHLLTLAWTRPSAIYQEPLGLPGRLFKLALTGNTSGPSPARGA